MVILHDNVTSYVKHLLLGFEIRRVQRDGLCILHAFAEEIFHLRDIHKSIPDAQEVLNNQLEKNKEHYSHLSADTKDIMVESDSMTPWGCL